MNITELSSRDLLALHAQIGEVLRERKILRSSNNQTGDLAEHLFCIARGLQPTDNSYRGVDVISPEGTRYQIKGRRCKDQDKLRQLSAIRNLDDAQFHFLVGIIFSLEYKVQKAALIPFAAVKALVRPDRHTNSHRFLLKDDVGKCRELRTSPRSCKLSISDKQKLYRLQNLCTLLAPPSFMQTCHPYRIATSTFD